MGQLRQCQLTPGISLTVGTWSSVKVARQKSTPSDKGIRSIDLGFVLYDLFHLDEYSIGICPGASDLWPYDPLIGRGTSGCRIATVVVLSLAAASRGGWWPIGTGHCRGWSRSRNSPSLALPSSYAQLDVPAPLHERDICHRRGCGSRPSWLRLCAAGCKSRTAHPLTVPQEGCCPMLVEIVRTWLSTVDTTYDVVVEQIEADLRSHLSRLWLRCGR